MTRIKLTDNLFLDEYIPKELYEKYKHKPHRLIAMLDSRMIKFDQALRERFGRVTINNWASGGSRQWSGIRTPDSSYYSFTSQHSWGRASDKLFKDASAEEVRSEIIENFDSKWKEFGVTCLEDNVSWVHSDFRMLSDNLDLLIVTP